MKAMIFHGSGGSPEAFWLPWLKGRLEARGYEVEVPAFPHPDEPELQSWLKAVAPAARTFDDQTILIGHSVGASLILSLLERARQPIRQAVLVAGFYRPLGDDPAPMLQETYDWKRIKENCREFVFINSDNDPWGCDDKMGREMLDKLGGTLVVAQGQGHMGSTSFNQPYREFPLLEKLVAWPG